MSSVRFTWFTGGKAGDLVPSSCFTHEATELLPSTGPGCLCSQEVQSGTGLVQGQEDFQEVLEEAEEGGMSVHTTKASAKITGEVEGRNFPLGCFLDLFEPPLISLQNQKWQWVPSKATWRVK